MATKRDDTFVQLMLRYTRYILTKRLHKHTGILVKYYSYSNRVENIALSEFCKHTSKTGSLFLYQIKEVCTFATGVTAFCVCYPLPSFI